MPLYPMILFQQQEAELSVLARQVPGLFDLNQAHNRRNLGVNPLD